MAEDNGIRVLVADDSPLISQEMVVLLGSRGYLPIGVAENGADAVEKATSLGASIIVEKQEVPNMGYFVIIADPTGATIGLWQAA